MRNLPLFIKYQLVFVLTSVLQFFIDSDFVAFVAFLAGFFLTAKLKEAWWLGSLGSGIPWFVYSAWLDFGNEHILSTRMAGLFHLPHSSLMLLLTFVVAFVVGGIAALQGYYLSKFINN